MVVCHTLQHGSVHTDARKGAGTRMGAALVSCPCRPYGLVALHTGQRLCVEPEVPEPLQPECTRPSVLSRASSLRSCCRTLDNHGWIAFISLQQRLQYLLSLTWLKCASGPSVCAGPYGPHRLAQQA